MNHASFGGNPNVECVLWSGRVAACHKIESLKTNKFGDMMTKDMILQSTLRIEPFGTFISYWTMEIPKVAFGHVHFSNACM